jgi:hypothetical protein
VSSDVEFTWSLSLNFTFNPPVGDISTFHSKIWIRHSGEWGSEQEMEREKLDLAKRIGLSDQTLGAKSRWVRDCGYPSNKSLRAVPFEL